MKYWTLTWLLFFCSIVNTSATEIDSSAEVNGKIPTVIASYGVTRFIGDVGYSHLNQPIRYRYGWQIALQFASRSRFSPSAYVLFANTSATEKSVNRNLNFQTQLACFGAQMKFNFMSNKRSDQILVPFLSAGVEYISFKPMGDLLDAQGNTYYYWADGSIKNIEESAPNAGSASSVYRDYEYETNLREANIDSLGSYSVNALGIPLGIGARLNLSSRCAVVFSSVLHLTTSDFIDNITAESKGSRQGNSSNDKFVFTSAAFSYDIGAPRDTPKKKRYRDKDFKNIDFKQLVKDDIDKDGVPDFEDESPDTPAGVTVDAKGKPLDGDGDGIADYRDKEKNTTKGALVNENGITLTDKLIEEKFRQDSLDALPTIREYVRSTDRLKELNPSVYKNQSNGIPPEYAKVDADKNGVITPKEIGDAIDEFLAGKSSYNTDQFYKLIDFYFSQ